MDTTQDGATDVPGAAQYLNVCPATIRRMVRRGDLHAIQLGGPRGRYRIRRSDLDALLAGEPQAQPEIRDLAEQVASARAERLA